MQSFKTKLWLSLMAIGLLGVASMLLSDLPLDMLPEEATALIPPETLRFLLLLNPALMLMITTGIGVLVYDKAKFSVPLLEGLLGRPDAAPYSLREIILWGLALGLAAGLLLSGITGFFEPKLPEALTEANKSLNLSIVTKLLYGGVTEELMMRFGIMSLFAWLLLKVFGQLKTLHYLLAIVLAALLFGLGHFPALLMMVPDPDTTTYAYILLGNSAGGLLFGYAYWKKGLECAWIAHGFAHVVMSGVAAVMA